VQGNHYLHDTSLHIYRAQNIVSRFEYILIGKELIHVIKIKLNISSIIEKQHCNTTAPIHQIHISAYSSSGNPTRRQHKKDRCQSRKLYTAVTCKDWLAGLHLHKSQQACIHEQRAHHMPFHTLGRHRRHSGRGSKYFLRYRARKTTQSRGFPARRG
jgi:hypothetical protein